MIPPAGFAGPEDDGEVGLGFDGEELPVHVRGAIDRFLDLQAQELSVRAQETHVRELEVKVGYRFSRASLEVQERHLRDQRAEERKKRRDQLSFLSAWLLMLGALLIYLLRSGNEALAGEILKALLYLTTAGASGFFAGKSTERRKLAVEEP